jgi:hypothetical protein
MKKFFIYFFLTINFLLFSKDYEFIGVLKFNNTQYISYRILFEEVDGKISGYSITDLHGEHETKNKIRGFYNKKDNFFAFEEVDLEYTKSNITQNDFCRIKFQAKVDITSSSKKIKGFFQSYFSNGSKCISGELLMVASVKAEKNMIATDKKIKNIQKVAVKGEQVSSLANMLNELKLNFIKTNDTLSVFSESKDIFLKVYDSGTQDGDKINLYLNDAKILSDFEIKNEEKTVKLTLETVNSHLKISALNEGRIAPNTAKVILVLENGRTINLFSTLKTNEFAVIKIIHKSK